MCDVCATYCGIVSVWRESWKLYVEREQLGAEWWELRPSRAGGQLPIRIRRKPWLLLVERIKLDTIRTKLHRTSYHRIHRRRKRKHYYYNCNRIWYYNCNRIWWEFYWRWFSGSGHYWMGV